MQSTALPTYKELSDGMDAAMRRGMVASMDGDEEAKHDAMTDMRAYADKIKNGEHQ